MAGAVDAVVFAVYGTARTEAAAATIEPVVRAVADAATPVRCEVAYTSAPVVAALARRGVVAPAFEDVLGSLHEQGCAAIAVQPGFVGAGWALHDLVERADAFGIPPERVGRPLLSCEGDAAVLARALSERHPQRSGSALLLVAHGESWPKGVERGDASAKRARDFDALAALGRAFEELGRTDVVVSTMKDAAEAVSVVGRLGAGRAVVAPLMLAAGHHAAHELFGAQETSLSARLARAGIEAEPCDEGIGALAAVQELYAAHAVELCRA